METKLSPYERCSNFESVPNEDESAFDIMSEDFRREQQNLNNFARIRKYSRRPNIIRKENKKSKGVFKEIAAELKKKEVPAWLSLNIQKLE